MSKHAYFHECPRCGAHSFETLNSYSHCINYLYFEDYYKDTETCYAAVRALEATKINSSYKKNENEVEESNEPKSLAS